MSSVEALILQTSVITKLVILFRCCHFHYQPWLFVQSHHVHVHPIPSSKFPQPFSLCSVPPPRSIPLTHAQVVNPACCLSRQQWRPDFSQKEQNQREKLERTIRSQDLAQQVAGNSKEIEAVILKFTESKRESREVGGRTCPGSD